MAWPTSTPWTLVLTLVLVWLCAAFVDEVGGKRLLKALKTITSQDGDIYDCVDIYKQPSLEHPLLKNHKVQMKPSSYPMHMTGKLAPDEKFIDFGYKESCPLGTVGIRRTKEEDLVNAEFLQNSQRKYTESFRTQDTPNDGRHYALLKSEKGTHYGAHARLVVYGLPSVGMDQSSANQIVVAGGPPEQFNAIHVGWHVAPPLYKDTFTRLFSYWTANRYNDTCCLDTRGDGYVAIKNKLIPGATIKPLSTYNGTQYSIGLTVFRDPVSGNWWLAINDDGVGYFPKELFNHLDTADEIWWGGTVYSPLNEPSPPMGSGHLPDEGANKTCYFTQVELINKMNELYIPNNVQAFADIPAVYGIRADGDGFAYGGPGGFKA